MRYFELRQSKAVRNPIKIQWAAEEQYKYNPTREEFDKLPDMCVGYYEYDASVEIPDVLEGDTFFVSDELKKVLQMYDDTITFKGVQVYPFGMVENVVPTYWSFWGKEADCRHQSVVQLPNGDIKELILSADKLPADDIFKVEGLYVHRIIITLPVAESILRRKMYGISLKEVKVI